MTLASRFAWGLLLAAALIGVRGVWLDVLSGAWVGAAVMAVLVGIVFVAGRSLEEARRFFASQLRDGSSLVVERQKQLQALASNRVTPDFEVLREATEALLRTRGYLGRYFVAATILVGLVGTFAGIMTTLGDVAPLMNGGAASFRGLDVTFASSLVAVVITLGLTLLHGEVVSLETAVLSMLDERTAHEWAPALWPAPANTIDDKLEALSALQADLISVLKSTARIAQDERVEQTTVLRALQTRVDATQPLLAKTVDELRAHGDRVLEGLSQRLNFLTDELGTRVALLSSRVEDTHEKAMAGLGQAAARLTEAQRTGIEAVTKLQLDAAKELTAEQARASQSLASLQLESIRSLTHEQKQSAEDVSRIQLATATALKSAHVESAQVLAQLQLQLLTEQKQAIEGLTTLQLGSATELAAAQKQAAMDLATFARSSAEALASEQRQAATALAAMAHDAASALAAEQKKSATELAKLALDATTSLAADQNRAAAELAARALASATELAAEQKQSAAALAKAQLDSAERLAAVLQASTVQLGEAHQASALGVRELHMAIAHETGVLQKQAAEAIVALHRDAINETAKVQRGAATDVANMQLETTLELTKLQRESLTELSTLQRDAFNELNTLQRTSLTELTESQHSSAATLRDLQLEATQRQLDATTKAAETAASLAQATTALAPIAQELLPQVRSLAEQIALLATDARDGELDLATFGELERIGNGIEEMRALLDQARGKVAGDA